MVFILWIFLAGMGLFFLGKFVKHKSLYPFMPFRYDFRRRRDSFRLVLGLLDRIPATTLVETGTSREGLKGAKSNGGATLVFGRWAAWNGARLHSVDINPKSIASAKAAVDRMDLSEVVQLHLSDSVAFLSDFPDPVDFLYLDSYDYGTDPEVRRMSQEHHLAEYRAIRHRLHARSAVLIDDCDLPGGGKGKLVVAEMLAEGWRVVYRGYQILLVRKELAEEAGLAAV